MLLVPPGVKAPDGSLSHERRLFYRIDYWASVREYHDQWWEQ